MWKKKIQRHLKVVAEAELKRLRGKFEVALEEMDLCHEEVGICKRGFLFQAMLKTALSCLYVP